MNRAGPFADELENDAPDLAVEIRRARKYAARAIWWLRLAVLLQTAMLATIIIALLVR